MLRSRGARIGLILLLAVAAVIIVRVLSRENCPAAPADGPGVSRIDLGAQVVDVAAGPKGVWVIRRLYGGKRPHDLVELDPATGRIVGSPIAIPDFPSALAVGDDALWVLSAPLTRRPSPGTLYRVDPRSHRIVSRLQVGRGARSVSAGASGVWVANEDSRSVMRVDTIGKRVLATFPLAEGPGIVLARAGAVWAGSDLGGRGAVHKINPITGRQADDIEGILANVSPDAVWVIRNGPPNGQLLSFNPKTLREVGSIIGLDILPATVGVAGGDVWVGEYFSYCKLRNSDRPGLAPLSMGWFRIDPATHKRLSGPVHVGHNPRTPAFTAGAFWIAPDLGNHVIRIDLATASRVRPQRRGDT